MGKGTPRILGERKFTGGRYLPLLVSEITWKCTHTQLTEQLVFTTEIGRLILRNSNDSVNLGWNSRLDTLNMKFATLHENEGTVILNEEILIR